MPKAHSNETIEQIVQEYIASDLSSEAIGEKYFVTGATVRLYVNQLGHPCKSCGYHKHHKDMQQRMADWNSNMTGWDYARKYGYRDNASARTAVSALRRKGYGFMNKRTNSLPMLAVSDSALTEPLGHTAPCPKCKTVLPVKWGKDAEGADTSVAYVKCQCGVYLVGDNGKRLGI